MSQVKLISQDERTKGKIITLPIIGDRQFDSEDNSILVDEGKVADLLELDFGIKLIDARKIKENQKTDQPELDSNLAMLNGLSDEELDSFLVPYPNKIVRLLKTRESKIDYLAKEMAK